MLNTFMFDGFIYYIYKLINLKNYILFKTIHKGNEFNKSLDLDLSILEKYGYDSPEYKIYQKDLINRRNRAHELDI